MAAHHAPIHDHSYVSGWCESTSHERCKGSYAGTACCCMCHRQVDSETGTTATATATATISLSFDAEDLACRTSQDSR